MAEMTQEDIDRMNARGGEGLDYYDVDGKRIGLGDWAALFESRQEDQADESWWRKRTEISEDVEVSTVWLGSDHNFGSDGPPRIFETMVFGGEHDVKCLRYSTKAEAWDDHERVVRALRSGENPFLV